MIPYGARDRSGPYVYIACGEVLPYMHSWWGPSTFRAYHKLQHDVRAAEGTEKIISIMPFTTLGNGGLGAHTERHGSN